MPSPRKTAGKTSRGTSDATAPTGASRQTGRGKPKPSATPAVAPKGQKRTRAKSATAAPVHAPLKAKQAKPKASRPLTAAKKPRSAVAKKPKGAKKPAKESSLLRWRLVNAGLFLLLLLAVSIWARIHLATLKQLFVTLGSFTGFTILLSFLRFVPKKAISSVGEKVTKWLTRVLEDRRITPYVASLVVLGLPLATWDSYLHRQTYAVRIILGLPVLELVKETQVPPEKLFELTVKVGRSGVTSSRPITGPGRIYVGASEEYLRWRDGEDSAEEDYNKALANGYPRADDMKKWWSESPQFLPTSRISQRDDIRIELRCPRGKILYFAENVHAGSKDSKTRTIFVDPKDHGKFSNETKTCFSIPD
jgi:hypothetical protein